MLRFLATAGAVLSLALPALADNAMPAATATPGHMDSMHHMMAHATPKPKATHAAMHGMMHGAMHGATPSPAPNAMHGDAMHGDAMHGDAMHGTTATPGAMSGDHSMAHPTPSAT